MKDKITNFFLIISGLMLLSYICLFFMPEERTAIANFLRNQSSIEKKKKINFSEDRKDFIKKKLENAQEIEKKTTRTNKVEKGTTLDNIKLVVTKPIPLSYKSKKEIFDIRKSYVKNSPFWYEGYEPSDEVFGNIEDGKPWLSQYSCRWKDTGVRTTEGPSSISLPIINPTALVLIYYAFIPYKCEDVPKNCKFDFYPINITYNKDKKIVRVIYRQFEHIDPSKRTYYILTGINARDFGYKYAYVDLNKSTFIPKFVEKKNISTEVVEFQDLIHVGGSCRVEGGCNNHSPDDPNMRIYYSKRLHLNNTTLYIKLWKERPNSPEDEPDLVEILQINYM